MTEVRSRYQYCSVKAIRISYYERVSVYVVIQHAKRKSRIILFPLACLAISHLFASFYKQSDLGWGEGRKLFNIKCVLIFSTTFV